MHAQAALIIGSVQEDLRSPLRLETEIEHMPEALLQVHQSGWPSSKLQLACELVTGPSVLLCWIHDDEKGVGDLQNV